MDTVARGAAAPSSKDRAVFARALAHAVEIDAGDMFDMLAGSRYWAHSGEAEFGEALVWSCRCGREKMFEALKSGISDWSMWSKGAEALVAAAASGQIEMLSRLLALGVPADAPGPEGVAPLMCAVVGRHRQALEILLANGADAGSVGEEGCTVLMESCKRCDEEMAALLIQAGAPLDARDEQGKTALAWSALRSDAGAGCAKILLAAGAGVDICDEDGLTPLHLAAYKDAPGTLRLLIASGADLEAAYDGEAGPLDALATSLSYQGQKAALALLEAGARVDRSYHFGNIGNVGRWESVWDVANRMGLESVLGWLRAREEARELGKAAISERGGQSSTRNSL